MFYSSEAPNGTSTIQPEQTIFAFWKAVKTLWWSEHWRWLWYRQCLRNTAEASERIAQKCFLVTAETVTISQNISLSRNSHFPLRCGRNSAIFASLVVTHLAKAGQASLPPAQHQHPLYNRSFTIFPHYQHHHCSNVSFISILKKICPSYHNIILLLFMKGRHHFPRLFPLSNYHVFCRSHKPFFREEKQDYRAHRELLFALYLPRSDSQTVAPMHTCPPWTGTSADLPWGRCCVKR